MRKIAFGEASSEEDAMERELEELTESYNDFATEVGLSLAGRENVLSFAGPGLDVGKNQIEAHRAKLAGGPQGELGPLESKERELRSKLKSVLVRMAKMDEDHDARKQRALGSEQGILNTRFANYRMFCKLKDELAPNIEELSAEIDAFEAEKALRKSRVPALAEKLHGLRLQHKSLQVELEASRDGLKEVVDELAKQDASSKASRTDLKTRRKEVAADRKASTQDQIDTVQRSYASSLAEVDDELDRLGDVFGTTGRLLMKLAVSRLAEREEMARGNAIGGALMEAMEAEADLLNSRHSVALGSLARLSKEEADLERQIAELEDPDRSVDMADYRGALGEMSELNKEIQALEKAAKAKAEAAKAAEPSVGEPKDGQ
jgi:chromosome segregation ATPase